MITGVPPETLRALHERSALRSALDVAACWGILVAAIALVLVHPAWWAYLIAVPIIASRQYGLAVLLHEGIHYLLCRGRRANDLVAEYLLALPIGADLHGQRAEHWLHHQHLGTALDPIWPHYAGEDKQRRGRLLWYFVKQLLGFNLLNTVLNLLLGGKRVAGGPVAEPAGDAAPPVTTPAGLEGRINSRWFAPKAVAYQAALLGVFFLCGRWWDYLLLWLLPLATLGTLFNRVREFTEHFETGDPALDDPDRRYVIISNPLERFFIAPFHFPNHAEHHIYAQVPHHRLPDLHRALVAAGTPLKTRRGYTGFVLAMLRRPGAPGAG